MQHKNTLFIAYILFLAGLVGLLLSALIEWNKVITLLSIITVLAGLTTFIKGIALSDKLIPTKNKQLLIIGLMFFNIVFIVVVSWLEDIFSWSVWIRQTLLVIPILLTGVTTKRYKLN